MKSFYKNSDNNWIVNGEIQNRNSDWKVGYHTDNTYAKVTNDGSIVINNPITEIEKDSSGNKYDSYNEFNSAISDFFVKASGGSGEASWGGVSGNIEDQEDLTNALNSKVDKVEGKQLSDENYTSFEKDKLSNIQAGAQVNPTPFQIKTMYEENPDTNAFTDDDKNKLDSLRNGNVLVVDSLPSEIDPNIVYIVNPPKGGGEEDNIGYYIDKDTGDSVSFNMDVDYISGTTFNSPPWMEDASEISLPKNIETIGDSALADAPNLKTVYLYDKVSSLGNNVFQNTPLLENVYVYGEVPPSVGSFGSDFGEEVRLQLKVPADSYDLYRNHSSWGTLSAKLFVLNDLIPGSRVHGGYVSQGTIREYHNESNLILENLEFDGGVIGAGNAISISSSNNVIIRNCRFKNIPNNWSLYIWNCTNVIVYNCDFDNIRSGILTDNCKGGIRIFSNDIRNVIGNLHGSELGNAISNIHATGGNFRIQDNAIENIIGESSVEDVVTSYNCYYDISSPLIVRNNYLRGGGPSSSSGGIMSGDYGGANMIVENNKVVNSGLYGIAAAGGTGVVIRNNLVFQSQEQGVRNGLYAINWYPGIQNPATSTFINNRTNAEMYWNNESMEVSGWETNTAFDESITTDILPPQIIGLKSTGGSFSNNGYIYYEDEKIYIESLSSGVYDEETDEFLSEILRNTGFRQTTEEGYRLVSIKGEVAALAAPGHGHLSTEINDIAGRIPYGSVQLLNRDLDTVVDPGFYFQNESAYAIISNNYPKDLGQGCNLEVYHQNIQAGVLKQVLTPTNDRNTWVRYGTEDSWQGWFKLVPEGLTPQTSIRLYDTSIDDLITPGFYHQGEPTYVTVLNGYPANVTTGLLYVEYYNRDVSYVKQTYKPNTGETYMRFWNGVSWDSWRMSMSLPAGNIPSTSMSLLQVDLNTLLSPAYYFQSEPAYATALNNYPSAGATGTLEVVYFNIEPLMIIQRYYPNNERQIYQRTYAFSSWGSWINIVPFVAAQQNDSSASTVEDLVSDFNNLLAKLRTAGLLSP